MVDSPLGSYHWKQDDIFYPINYGYGASEISRTIVLGRSENVMFVFMGEYSMYLYHYYDKTVGPFRSLSDLSVEQAKDVLETIKRTKPNSQSAQRHDKYVEYRHNCENIIRSEFAKKGGQMTRTAPHYMVVEHSPWLSTWFENCECIKIPIEEFDINTISFTYGDSMPTFSPTINDGKEYRKKLYTYPEILEIIDKYGLPQEWNNDGKFGPERYIEVHVWSDETIKRYI